MNRYKVTATITVDVTATDVDDATDIVACAVRRAENVNDSTCDITSTELIPYHVPAGAERWAAAAKRRRFDDTKPDGGRRRLVIHEGNWWWTNGHIALLCEGAPPPESDWEYIDRDVPKSFAFDADRKVTAWGVEVKELNAWRTPMTALRAFANHDVALQKKYHDLIVESVPGCTWHIAGERDPIHARDVEGKVVAVVMPVVGNTFEPAPAPAPESRGGEP